MDFPETTDSEIRKRLQRRISQLGDPSYREIGQRTGYAHQAVQRYVSGTTEGIPARFLATFSLAYRTSLIWLMLGQGLPEEDTRPDAAAATVGQIERLLLQYHANLRTAD